MSWLGAPTATSSSTARRSTMDAMRTAKGQIARLDLKGRRFGRLLVESFHEIRHRQSYWLCVCDCGERKVIQAAAMLSTRKNHTVSCGCRGREIQAAMIRSKPSLRHGHAAEIAGHSHMSSIYACWINMRRRCLKPRHKSYPQYGGRGIKICDRWLDEEAGFENFLADMGERPSELHSIDRINPNGDYEPSNCRWATTKEQSTTKRLARERVLAVLASFEAEAPDLIARLREELFGRTN